MKKTKKQGLKVAYVVNTTFILLATLITIFVLILFELQGVAFYLPIILVFFIPIGSNLYLLWAYLKEPKDSQINQV